MTEMPAHNQSGSLWWRRATLTGAQRVIVVAIAVGACSAAVAFLLLHTATPQPRGVTLPWWSASAALVFVLLLGGFLLAPVSSRIVGGESRRRAESPA